jgi:hypothetical protein
MKSIFIPAIKANGSRNNKKTLKYKALFTIFWKEEVVFIRVVY